MPLMLLSPFLFSKQSMDNSTSSAAPASSPPFFDFIVDDDMAASFLDTDRCPNIFESSGLDQAVTQYSESEYKRKRISSPEITKKIERKKLSDRNYRQRRREQIDHLCSELSRLREENEILKIEMLNKNNTLQSQEEMIRQLKQSFDQLNTQNINQSVVVRVISEKLHSASDLQRENEDLNKQIDHLMSLIDNPNKFEIFKLEQEKAESERETRILKVLVEALCEKIHHHETHKGQQQLL